MIDCTGLNAGAPVIACISEATDYRIGYILLMLIVGIIYFRLGEAPTRERLAATMFITAIISFMGSINNILFPDSFFALAAVAFLGSLVMLIIRN